MIDILILGLFIFACSAAVLRPSWAFAFVFAMYSFEQALQSSGGLFLARPYLGNLCVGVSVGVCVAHVAIRERNLFYGFANYASISIVLLLCWAAFSLLWSPSYAAGSVFVIGGLPYVALFVFAIPLLVYDIPVFGSMLNKIMYLGTLILLLILLSPNFNFRDGRIGFNLTAIYRSNPLALGELAGTIVIIAVLLRVDSSRWAFNIWRLMAFFVGALAGLQSGSRGQLGFAIIIAIIFYPVSRRIKNFGSFFATIAGLVVIITGVLVIASKGLLTVTLSRWDATNLEGGAGHRLTNILDLMAVWASHPFAWIAGLGSNAYSSVTATGGHEEYAHNVAVEILCELGLPAFVLFVSILFVSVKNAIWLFRRFSQDPAERAILSVLYALFFYQLSLALKQGNLWNSVALFCLASIIARLYFRVSSSDQFENDDDSSNSDLELDQREIVRSNIA